MNRTTLHHLVLFAFSSLVASGSLLAQQPDRYQDIHCGQLLDVIGQKSLNNQHIPGAPGL